jgi:hypothetical protein
MLHLLREASMDKAIEFYGDTSQIPNHNIEKMEVLGKSKLDDMFAVCMAVDKD